MKYQHIARLRSRQAAAAASVTAANASPAVAAPSIKRSDEEIKQESPNNSANSADAENLVSNQQLKLRCQLAEQLNKHFGIPIASDLQQALSNAQDHNQVAYKHVLPDISGTSQISHLQQRQEQQQEQDDIDVDEDDDDDDVDDMKQDQDFKSSTRANHSIIDNNKNQFHHVNDFGNNHDKNKKLFPQKLWDLIHDPRYQHCLRWSQDGKRVYLNRSEFEVHYLKTPANQFHTQKAISFVRQMNMYGFRKVNDSFYENDNFKRSKQHLLRNMIRRHPNKGLFIGLVAAAANAASSQNGQCNVSDISHHHQLNSIVSHQQQQIQAAAAQSATLQMIEQCQNEMRLGNFFNTSNHLAVENSAHHHQDNASQLIAAAAAHHKCLQTLANLAKHLHNQSKLF